ncbi:MAG: hypothetical protein ACM3QX_17625 [Syntrophomonadaceae bacterium]
MRKFLFLLLFTLGSVSLGNSNTHKAGIYQLTKYINERYVCYGVMIQLEKLSFKKIIDQDEISITDAKYSRELKSILVWHVDKSRKTWIIKLKNENGDFGSGDDITVIIKPDAFENVHNQSYTFAISTDPI